ACRWQDRRRQVFHALNVSYLCCVLQIYGSLDCDFHVHVFDAHYLLLTQNQLAFLTMSELSYIWLSNSVHQTEYVVYQFDDESPSKNKNLLHLQIENAQESHFLVQQYDEFQERHSTKLHKFFDDFL